MDDRLELHKLWLDGIEGGVRLDLRCEDMTGGNFEGANLSKANLREADFRYANLCRANLHGADIRYANFFGACLDGADLRGANITGVTDLSNASVKDVKYSVKGVPGVLDIHRTVYHAASAEGALNMDVWHRCDTTHCRAGWVVHLAGDRGYELEKQTGTGVAAALIYLVSDPDLERIPDFYCNEKTALKDMKRLAEGK